ncbi:hypothetical protein ES703_114139 [subsurface metagenome]
MAWVSPTGHVAGIWSYEERAYDEDTDTYAYVSVSPEYWSDPLELTHDAINCDKIRFNAYSDYPIDYISIEAYYEDGWHAVYEGLYASHTWVEKPIPAGEKSVTAIRIMFWNDDAEEWVEAWFYEFDFWEVEVPPPVYTPRHSGTVGVLMI